MTTPLSESLDELTGEELSLLKPIFEHQKRSLLLQIYRSQFKATRIINNQGNMTSPKETNKTMILDPKEMEIYELSEKEFRMVIKKISEL